MYTPHTVTLIVADETDDGMHYNPVILDGVFLDLSKRSNINRSGLADADAATLFIPFSVKAYYPDQEHKKSFLGLKAYAAMEDKSVYWTLFDGGESSGADCFFIKGIIDEEVISYSEAIKKYDFVYHVSTVDLRDFGREHMRHWQVGGR